MDVAILKHMWTTMFEGFPLEDGLRIQVEGFTGSRLSLLSHIVDSISRTGTRKEKLHFTLS